MRQTERNLFFLLKCAYWLSLVFLAIFWSRPEPASTIERPSSMKGSGAASASWAKRSAKPQPAAQKEDVFTSLSRQMTSQLQDAARRRCLDQPQVCLEAIGALHSDVMRRKENR